MDAMLVKIWLEEKGVKQADIARQLGITRSLVWMTIHGRSRNSKVISWLLNNGCPSSFVCKPKGAPNN